MKYIGVDVGGTQIKMGIIENNQIIARNTLNTNKEDVLRQVEDGIRYLLANNNLSVDSIAGVVVGYPGMVVNGSVLGSPNTGVETCDLQTLLSEKLGCKCVVFNDGDMAALAEYKLGAGVGSKNMIMLTVGTGVGGGIIVDGKLYVGVGGAGEFGHINFKKNGLECGCGRCGCVEKYISLTALDRRTREIISNYSDSIIDVPENTMIRAVDLIVAYNKGDECAKQIIDEYVEDFASCLLDYCNILRSERVVIGGGLSYCPKIIEKIAKACEKAQFGYYGAPEVEIVAATLGNDAGMLGACTIFGEDGKTVNSVVVDTNEVDNGAEVITEESVENNCVSEDDELSQESQQEESFDNVEETSKDEISDETTEDVVDEGNDQEETVEKSADKLGDLLGLLMANNEVKEEKQIEEEKTDKGIDAETIQILSAGLSDIKLNLENINANYEKENEKDDSFEDELLTEDSNEQDEYVDDEELEEESSESEDIEEQEEVVEENELQSQEESFENSSNDVNELLGIGQLESMGEMEDDTADNGELEEIVEENDGSDSFNDLMQTANNSQGDEGKTTELHQSNLNYEFPVKPQVDGDFDNYSAGFVTNNEVSDNNINENNNYDDEYVAYNSGSISGDGVIASDEKNQQPTEQTDYDYNCGYTQSSGYNYNPDKLSSWNNNEDNNN